MMATVTDGTTSLDLGYVTEAIDPVLEKTTLRTAGGNLRSVTSGERLRFKAQARLSKADYRTFINLLKNGASNYFFTPTDDEEWTDLYPTTTWPLNANIYNIKRAWDNRTKFYVDFMVESVSYV
jgi:hypothetical protein